MISRRIKGYARVLGAPENWDPKVDGECGGLAVRIQPYGQGVMCESAWEPTPKELEMLQNGGSLILRIIGWQPPVALYVEPPEREEKATET